MAADGQAADYIWYHDLKWDRAKMHQQQQQLKSQLPGQTNQQVRLELSDGRRVEVCIQSVEQLTALIKELERAI